ncbi:MMPL family transporter [Amycolatopsis sp. 195334CR]|uniref:MMPL family transporter n=1 Tax=Amycolatopsis sp. 195334CR TaxID=2814588 RepID=UPI001A8F61F6|nr:MMPL family transporter [Amycolatopsis sp. 195334CR]MBN6034793.1 MMPL family transporter [Amycolatopsis sp. 195334CR]
MTVRRIARWSATHPWQAIVGWLAFVAIAFAAGTMTGTTQAHGEDFWIGEAGRAEQLAAEGGVSRPPVENVLITPASEPAAAEVAQRVRGLPGVADVDEPQRSPDGGSLLVVITMAGDDQQAGDHIEPVIEQVDATAAAHPDVRLAQTGDASMERGLSAQLGQGVLITKAITLPVTLLILFLVFGSLLAAGIPLVLALTAILGSVGLYGLASVFFPDAGGAVTSILLMMGMAVGVDYSLFALKRVREERDRSRGQLSHAAAVEIAAATSGRAIVVSGLAVIVSLVGLYLAKDVIFSSIATGTIIVVAVAVLSAVTVLPALLAKLGPRLDSKRQAKPPRVWNRMLRPAVEHPVPTLLVGLLLIGALAIPGLNMKLGVEGINSFPRSVPEIAAYDELVAEFPDHGASHMVVIRGEDSAQAAADLATPGSRIVSSVDGQTQRLEIPIPYSAGTPEADDSLAQLRAQPKPVGVEVAISGEPARGVDYSAHQADRLPWVIGFVLLATFVMMALAFRSVVIGALGLVLNLLSVLAAWGALVVVFQGTWAEGLLGFTSTGFIGSRTPLMLFAILFGLSMDYQIFVVSRIREAVARGLPTREAVVDGITGSARVVTSAALVMVSVFVGFMFIDRIEMKQIGLGLALAVLLDVVIVRILLLPAAMSLLGKASWWPGRVAELAVPVRTPAGRA